MTLSDKSRMILDDSLNPPLLRGRLSCKVRLILCTCLTEALEDISLMPVKCSKNLREKQTIDIWILGALIQLLKYKVFGSGNKENSVELECLNAKSPALITSYVELFVVWPELHSINVGYLEINEITMSCHGTVYLFNKVLHPCDLRGTDHIAKPVTKAWISMRVGKTERADCWSWLQ